MTYGAVLLHSVKDEMCYVMAKTYLKQTRINKIIIIIIKLP